MKAICLTALLLGLSTSAFAQSPPPPASYTLAICQSGTMCTPAQTLPVSLTAPACNQNPPSGWPNFGETANFTLTDAPIPTATMWWTDMIATTPSVTKLCAYQVQLWLNTIKSQLPAGTYPVAIRAVGADGQVSAWTPLNVSFLRPAAPTLPPAAIPTLRFVGR